MGRMSRDPLAGGGPEHRVIDVGGIELHIAERGSGPAVIMCHGFPGLWYSWRHQLSALAAAGFRAIAPDMRGYGRSAAPADPRAYDRTSTVADLVGLLDALGIDEAVFVGHDFGAVLTWDLPQWAAGRVRALIQLSVPRTRTPNGLPSAAFAQVAAKHFFHMHYFQQPGQDSQDQRIRQPNHNIAYPSSNPHGEHRQPLAADERTELEFDLMPDIQYVSPPSDRKEG